MKKKDFGVGVLVWGAVLSLVVLTSSTSALAAEKGSIIGFVYDKDGTTPLEGAVVQFKNLSTDKLLASGRTDKFGIFRLEGVESGVYVYGVVTARGNFNSDGPIAVKVQPRETAKISISLQPYDDAEAKALKEMFKELEISGEALIGTIIDFNSSTQMAGVQITKGRLQVNDRIHARGRTTDFYQDLKVVSKGGSPASRVLAGESALIQLNQRVQSGDLLYVVKRKELLSFLLVPVGLAAIIAGSSAIQIGTKIEEDVRPASAFKK